MKMIESGGGALIGIHRSHLEQWSGVFGNNFFRGMFFADNDYDALYNCAEKDSSSVIGIGDNDEINIFFMSEPFPTLIVDATSDHIYIAQIDTSEEVWSESQLGLADFEKISEWQSLLDFHSPGGEIIFFDSAGDSSDLDGDYLSAILKEGIYACSWVRQRWEGKANIIFIRMKRKDGA